MQNYYVLILVMITNKYVNNCKLQLNQKYNYSFIFRPTQCNQNRTVCWCVNDNGEVLPGTKQTTNQDTNYHCGKNVVIYCDIYLVGIGMDNA